MGRLEGVSPIVPVRDIAVSTAFYRDTLGFEIRTETPDFGLAARGEAAFSLVKTADDAALTATRTNMSAYVWVQDLDDLWAELHPKLAALPEGRVRAPFDQPYGMREFHVKDPDGFLILFGENAAEEGEP